MKIEMDKTRVFYSKGCGVGPWYLKWVEMRCRL